MMNNFKGRAFIRSCKWAFLGAVFLLAAYAGAASDLEAMGKRPPAKHQATGAAVRDPGSRTLTYENLQHELFQFVDRYRERVGQVTDERVRLSDSGAKRVMFQATKVSYVSAAMSIVSGPRPLDALRDLLVMVKLQRMVWETGADGNIPPADSQPLARVLRTLEGEIFDLAARVLPADAITKLRVLIKEWRRQNPDQHYVAFVRFNNLGSSPVTDEVKDAFASGGFLAPIESVAREAHEARLFAERSMFLANRMPALLGWQVELAYQRIAASPEAIGLMRDLDGYRSALELLGREVQRLPDKVAVERKAVVVELAQLIAKERAESLRSIQSILKSEREEFFSGLSDSAQTYGPILERLEVTAGATRDTVVAIERLTASLGGDTDGMALKSIQEVAKQLTEAARNTKDIVLGLQSLFDSELRGLPAVDAMLAAQAERFFLYGAAMVLLVGLVLYVVLRTALRRKDKLDALK